MRRKDAKKRTGAKRRTGARRGLACLLALCMLLTLQPLPAFAAEPGQDAAGLSEQQTGRAPDCGYEEAVEGQPCGHKVHTADCYTDELICGFDTEGEQNATVSGAAPTHEHTRECYRLDCPHLRGQHDKACGYNTVTVTGFAPLTETGRTVPAGTALEDLGLPASLQGEGYIGDPQAGASLVIEGVCWQSDPAYEGAAGQSYTFTALLPQGYETEAPLPVFTVAVTAEETDLAALNGKIDALPTTDDIYNTALPDSDPGYADWLAGTRQTLALAVDLLAQYKALTEEQREQVGPERADKLAALTDLAERLNEADALAGGEPWIGTGDGSQASPYLLKTYGDLAKLAEKVNGGTAYENKYFKLDAGFPADSGKVTAAIGDAYAHPFKGFFDGSGKTVVLEINDPDSNYRGLFGYVNGGTIKNVTVAGSVIGFTGVGGVAGYLRDNASVTGCVNQAAVTSGAFLFPDRYRYPSTGVGGVVGESAGSGLNKVENCYNTGKVNGAGSVGGIVGINGGGVDHCYNTGKILGTHGRVGGIVGENTNRQAKTANCVSLGCIVTGAADAGRLLGYAGSSAGGVINGKARADMRIGAAGQEAVPTADIEASKRNGESVAVDGSVLLSTVFGGWSTDIWNIPAESLRIGGVLPALKANAQSPAPILSDGAPVELWRNGSRVGGYADLTSAIRAAISGDTVRLADALTLTDGVSLSGKNLTLDLNGYSVTCDSYEPAISVAQSVTLTVADGTGRGAIRATGGGAAIYNQGTVTVSGGTLSAAGDAAIYNLDMLNISGGSVSSSGTDDAAIYNYGRTLNVSGGTISGNRAAIESDGKVAISGSARVTATEAYTDSGAIRITNAGGNGPALAVTGGAVENTAGGWSVYFTDGSGVTEENQSSYYSHTGGTVGQVRFASVVAELTVGGVTTEFTSLQKAVEAVPDGETGALKLLSDVAGFVSIANNSDETFFDIDLNGYAWTGTGNGALRIENGAAVTIADTRGSGSMAGAAGSSAVWVVNGSLTVTGGVFTGSGGSAQRPTAALALVGIASTAALRGGTFTGSGENAYAIYIDPSVGGTVGGLLDGGFGYRQDGGWITGEAVLNGKMLAKNGTVAVRPLPTVTGVSVTPTSANVQKGMSQQFTASVAGENSPNQAVNWSVEGNVSGGTSVSASGLLTVAEDETAARLTVRATSAGDSAKSGTAEVTVVSVPVTRYLLTVNGGSGTGEYAAGAEITVTADAPAAGKRFKAWMADGIALADPTVNPVTVRMPANAAALTAVYEDVSAPVIGFTVTFHANGGSVNPATARTGSDGRLGSLPIPANGDYRFEGWYTAADGGDQITAETVFTQDTTVYAHWSHTGGSDTPSAGPDDKSDDARTDDIRPNSPVTAETDVTAGTDNKGSAEIDVPGKMVDSAIDKALAAGSSSAGENGVAVRINVNTGRSSNGQQADTITVNLPKETQERLIDRNADSLTLVINQPRITISLDLDAIKAINKQANANVQLTVVRITDSSKLSADARAAVGSRPVFRLSASYPGGEISDFGSGSVTLEIPYELQSGKQAGSLYLVYIDDRGKIHFLTDSSYDVRRGVLMGSTNHYSLYGVGYKAPAVRFRDIQNHWAREDIEFVVSRGLLDGAGGEKFSPDSPMTRAMFVTALGRLAGINPADYKPGAFSDVPATADCAPYAEWAVQKGIVREAGSGKFEPDTVVTRQQMAVILENYARAMGFKVPATREALTFDDNADIVSWAAAAVNAMQRAGVLMGKDGSRFDPTGPATRAQASAALRRYIELVINWRTAQGWSQNDSGTWMYYQDGRPVTGEKVIDGTTCRFDERGLLLNADAVASGTGEYIIHRIVHGDTLWDLARANRCTVAGIVFLNRIKNPSFIPVGMEIKIPAR